MKLTGMRDVLGEGINPLRTKNQGRTVRFAKGEQRRANRANRGNRAKVVPPKTRDIQGAPNPINHLGGDA